MTAVITWDYDQSVAKMRMMVTSWRTLTVEMAEGLYRAREALSAPGARTDLRPDGRRLTWESYLNDAGLADRTARRWLERYLPDEQRLIEPEELEVRKQISKEPTREQIAAGLEDLKQKKAEARQRAAQDQDVRAAQARIQAEADERERKYQERKKETEDSFWEATDNINRIVKATGEVLEREQKRRTFKERIKLSQDGKRDTFIDALMDYLDELDDDNRRLEACNNIIKVAKTIAAQLHQKSVSA